MSGYCHTSWGKSGCEQNFYLPITGGLHRSSGDIDTESLPIPIWCYANKSKSLHSSIRTHVAAVAYLDKQTEFSMHSMKHHRTKHKRYLNALQKNTKQGNFIQEVNLCNIALSNRVQCLTSKYIKNTVVICNRGKEICTVKEGLHNNINICMLKISSGDLWVADTVNPTIGLCMILQGKSSPVLIRLPQNISLRIMSNGRSRCVAMRSCAQSCLNHYQEVSTTMCSQRIIMNIIALVRNQAEQKEESSWICTN